MRRLLVVLAAALIWFSPAKAVDSTLPALTAASAFAGTDLLYIVQSGATVERKGTPAQMATYIYGLASGDCTISGVGAVVCTKTNGTAFGALATVTAGTGVATAAAVNIGSAGAFVTFNGALGTPSSAILTNATGLPISGTTGYGTGVAAALASATNGAGGFITFGNAVSSVTPGGGLVSGITASCTQTAITTSGTLSISGCVNAQVGTSYALADGDRGKLVTLSNASAVAVSLAQAGTASAFANGWLVDVVNKGAGTVTITPTTSTINGAATLVLTTGQGARIFSDGTNYQVNSGAGTGGSGISSLTPGGGLVSGVTASCTQTAITTSGTLSEARCLNAQSGTSYAIVDGDRGKLITGSNAAAQAYSIAQAGAASAFANGWMTSILNKGVGTLTITPATSTINGAATYALFAGQSITLVSDGTNYQVDPGTTGGVTINTQSGANYAFAASDFGKLVNLSNASNQIPTLPIASAVGAKWFVQACNQGAGTQTITPATSTIGGAATYVLAAGTAAAPKCVSIVSDGTNYQVVPDLSGGTPAGSSGDVQYNNAGSFGGFTMANDCTLAQPNINCNLAHPGFVANFWYLPANTQSLTTTFTVAVANVISCSFASIPRPVTILGLSATVTAVGTTNNQYAIYASASGRPGALIGNTGSVTNTSTGPRTANLVASKSVGPGGTNGGRDLWFCSNQNDSTVAYMTAVGSTGTGGAAQLIAVGDSAGIGSGLNDFTVGINCSGANCNGGSSTFGTWPATLAGSTWGVSRPSTTGANVPVIQFQAQ